MIVRREHVAAAENSEFAEPIRPDADPDAPDSMYASSAPAQLLRAYLKEHTAAADFSEPLNAALKLARTNSSTASVVAKLEAESTELKQLTTEGEAWRPLVTAVVAKLDAAAADAALLAATHTEQAQVGLAALRACFCASIAIGTPDPASIEPLCAALLQLVFTSLARVRAAQADGVFAAHARPDDEQDDAVTPSLETLGCASVLANLRSQPLHGLLEAAAEAESCIEPKPETVDEALLLAAARAACLIDDESQPVHAAAERHVPTSASVAQLAAGHCGRRWDACCTQLAAICSDEGSSGESSELSADGFAAASALLKVLRWWRPLVLGIPPKPTWYRRAKDVAALYGAKGDKALLVSAAVHMQTRWRARRARRVAAHKAVMAAGQSASTLSEHESLRCRVLRARAALLLDQSADASAAALVAAARPAEAIDALHGMQRRLALQLASLAMTVCAASSGSDGAASARRSPTAPTMNAQVAQRRKSPERIGTGRRRGGLPNRLRPGEGQPRRAAPPLWPSSKALLALAARGGGRFDLDRLEGGGPSSSAVARALGRVRERRRPSEGTGAAASWSDAACTGAPTEWLRSESGRRRTGQRDQQGGAKDADDAANRLARRCGRAFCGHRRAPCVERLRNTAAAGARRIARAPLGSGAGRDGAEGRRREGPDRGAPGDGRARSQLGGPTERRRRRRRRRRLAC